jgi:hypothetical protein
MAGRKIHWGAVADAIEFESFIPYGVSFDVLHPSAVSFENQERARIAAYGMNHKRVTYRRTDAG